MLTELFRQVYPFDDKEIPLELLRKYDFENLLLRVLETTGGAKNSTMASMLLVTFAPIVVQSVNSRLNKAIPEDKARLEILCVDVLSFLMQDLLKKSNHPRTDLQNLRLSLENLYKLEGHDFPTLMAILKYDELEKAFPKDTPVIAEKYWYVWTGKPHELDFIASKLYKQCFIKSVKEFRKLFEENHPLNLAVSFARESINFLIVLFDELKVRKLISPKGNNGHFHPLRVYGVDFEGKLLIVVEPKTIKAALKNDPEKLRKLQEKANDWLEGITPRLTSNSPLGNQRQISKTNN